MGKNILIVEDEPGTRELFAAGLELHGYEVGKAANGREALDLVLDHTPDLILLDIMMPEMSGLEFLMRLRRVTRQIVPVIVVSALSQNQLASLPGVERRLVKGDFTLDKLVQTIEEVIGT